MPIFYQSPAMLIGKHEWRIIVKPSAYHGNCTEYQFRRIGQSYWRDSHDWPSYNINDGMYGGMPKTIARLYYQNEAEIKAALAGQSMPQISMEV